MWGGGYIGFQGQFTANNQEGRFKRLVVLFVQVNPTALHCGRVASVAFDICIVIAPGVRLCLVTRTGFFVTNLGSHGGRRRNF